MATTSNVDNLAELVLHMCDAPITKQDAITRLNTFIHDFDIDEAELIEQTARSFEIEHTHDDPEDDLIIVLDDR